MTLGIVFNVVLLPKFGGTINLEYLSAVCKLVIMISFIGLVLVCLGVSEFDKPENFEGLNVKKEPLKVKDMVAVLKENKPLQCYVAAAASDKIAQVTASQAVITTMMGGIIIGNMGLSSILEWFLCCHRLYLQFLVQDMQESTEVRKQLPHGQRYVWYWVQS